jgi:hypothetical protein
MFFYVQYISCSEIPFSSHVSMNGNQRDVSQDQYFFEGLQYEISFLMFLLN